MKNDIHQALKGAVIVAVSIALLPLLLAQSLPVGYRLNQLSIITNTGHIWAGSNTPSRLWTTNYLEVSNAWVTVNAGGITNNGPTVVSNISVRGNANLNGFLQLMPSNLSFNVMTNNDVPVGNVSLLVLTNATNIYSCITGFAGGTNGQILHIINITPTNLHFIAESTSSTLGNRIDLGGLQATSTNTIGKGSATFIYDVNSTHTNWNLMNINY